MTSTRPFLSLIEKKWISFQLLYALNQIHFYGICHGDVKCENVLVTSSNWVYLSDFAPYKPTYIPVLFGSTLYYYLFSVALPSTLAPSPSPSLSFSLSLLTENRRIIQRISRSSLIPVVGVHATLPRRDFMQTKNLQKRNYRIKWISSAWGMKRVEK